MSTNTPIVQFIGTTPDELIKQFKEIVLSEISNDYSINQPSNDELDLLTRNEVVELLKINLSTLYRWQRDKTIPSYGIGNRIYFKRSDIINILNNNKLS